MEVVWEEVCTELGGMTPATSYMEWLNIKVVLFFQGGEWSLGEIVF
jgi:hypothetical protein